MIYPADIWLNLLTLKLCISFSKHKMSNMLFIIVLVKLSVIKSECHLSWASLKLSVTKAVVLIGESKQHAHPDCNLKLSAHTRIKREHTQTYRTGKSARSMEEMEFIIRTWLYIKISDYSLLYVYFNQEWREFDCLSHII